MTETTKYHAREQRLASQLRTLVCVDPLEAAALVRAASFQIPLSRPAVLNNILSVRVKIKFKVEW